MGKVDFTNFVKKNSKGKKPPPGMPTWAKNPKQDSFGNPTTKKPGDKGTEIGFPNLKGKQKWRDMQGAHGPHNSRDWKK